MRSGFSLADVKAEIVNNGGTVSEPFTLSQAIEIAGKTGEWNKLSNFAEWGYSKVSWGISLLFNYTGEPEQNYFFVTNEEWSVSADQDWIHIENNDGFGSGYISIYCDRNNTNNTRSGAVTITTASNIKGTITIIQSKPIIIEP